MTETLRLISRYSLIMCVFAMVSAAILAFTYQQTEPLRKANIQKIELAARQELLPQAVTFVPRSLQGCSFWQGLTADKKGSGYILKAVRRGYSSNIETLIALRPDFSIAAVKVLSQAETPGLGSLIETEKFTKQFICLTGKAIAVNKDGGAIDAVTGATISSRAVANSVYSEIEIFKQALKGRE